ncbi:hypothetical protein [Methanoculleus sp.]|jgi:hypothetical protein|nr:hypothetical protein [Methanoculleus sp.]MCK9319376.1 hypothetical protein [Methanoculleus sp.]
MLAEDEIEGLVETDKEAEILSLEEGDKEALILELSDTEGLIEIEVDGL